MSLESAKAFLARLKTDEEFSNRVASFTDEFARMEFIRQAGFTFSPSDISDAVVDVTGATLTTTADGIGMSRAGTFIADYPDRKS